MARRGYKPAAQRNEVQDIIAEVNAFAELVPELLTRIEDVCGDRLVTRTELKRDFGYSDSAIRLLEKTRQIKATFSDGGRTMYRLSQALAFRILQPGLAYSKHIRTVRKHANITTVHREFWSKITDRNTRSA